MPVLQDRVQETTTTGGTGTLTLAGAVIGYRSFNSAFTIGDITYYTIDNGAGEWEIGVGTVGSGTLSRTTVLESSNANALVNFSAGTKRVFCSAPTKVLLPNQTGNSGKVLSTDGVDPAWTTTLNGVTIGNITPAAGAFTTLSASSTVSGTGFSTYLASPPAIGGTTPAAGTFTTLGATGNVTLGDAAGDTLTINGTAVSIPNNLNFDSNTLFIDATNNNVGIGTSSPITKLSNTSTAWSGGTATDGFAWRSTQNDWAATILATPATGAGYGLRLHTLGTTSSDYPLWISSGAGSGSVLAVMNGSGNLGLGVTPSAWGGGNIGFEVNTGSAFSGYYAGGVAAYALWGNAVVSGGNAVYKVTGRAFQQTWDSSAGAVKWNLAASGTAGNAISFTQAMTLDASGNLGVGTTNPQAKIDVSGGTTGFYRSSTLGSNFFSTFSSGTNGDTYYANVYATGQYILRCEYRGSGLGGITTNGSTITYGGTSDQRLKNNIIDAPSALDSVNAIKVRSFDWKADGSHVDYGYIAQELLDVVPEAVYIPEDPEELLSVDFGKLTPRLVKAIQELHAEIESLKAKVH